MNTMILSKNIGTRRGFTLIELLTAIAIIAILAAILIPVIGNVRASANRAKCASNLSQLAKASLLFTSENKLSLPLLVWGNPAENTETDYWFNFIKSHLGHTAETGLPPVFRCPSDDKDDVDPDITGWAAISYLQAPVSVNKLLSVEEPLNTPMFLDAEVIATSNLSAANFEQRVRDQEATWRHETGINVAYWDGHVEFIEEPTYNKVFKITEE